MIAAAVALSVLAARENVPAPLLRAIVQLEACCAEERARALRDAADRVFPQYKDLREDRLGDWLEPLMLIAPGDFYEAWRYADEVYEEVGNHHAVELPIKLAGFVQAANYTPGRELRPNRVVIHDMEGTYEHVVNYFLEPTTQASAHFDVAQNGVVTQQVSLFDTAWHAGNWMTNHESIGIEHEGYADEEGWFTEPMLRASVFLVRYVTDRFGIPKDREHIIGHYEVPDPTSQAWFGGRNHHSDPCVHDFTDKVPTWHNTAGCRWDWDGYMKRVSPP